METVYWAYVDAVAQVARQGLVVSSGARVPGVPPDQVGDLVQETFIRAFAPAARDAYDGLRLYRPYLLTIVRNLLVDRARKSGREVPSHEALEASIPAPEPDAPEDFEDPKLVAVVNNYIEGLDPLLRSVYKHRYVLDQSQVETAQALGLTRQKVRTLEKRLRRGLEKALKRP